MADILVIDDDANLALALQMTLEQKGHACRIAEDADSGWKECQKRTPDLALLDLQLPDENGLELLARMRDQGLELPIIVMTAFGTVTNAVTAMKRGAADFIEKPRSLKDVCQLVVDLLKSQELARQLEEYSPDTSPEPVGPEIIGQCPEMKKVLALADKIAAVPTQPGIGLAATLILGETGTGKEVLARHIHQQGSKPDSPFVHVNCAAIPENLFEIEHFGHERGVFTDAKTAKQGLFETAHQGTLLLDEVGDMPLGMQAKLLMAIETGRFRRVGATAEHKVDVRVIAAANVDLEQKVQVGTFRADLYHRLKMFEIELPPLRDRGQDLFLLSEHFLQRFGSKLQKTVPTLLPETRQVMELYAWPGNVRELAHVLLRVLVTHEGDTITPSALSITDGDAPAPVEPGRLEFDFSNRSGTLAAVEEKLLRAALEQTGGNIAAAARLLGMTRGTLRYRLEKLGLI